MRDRLSPSAARRLALRATACVGIAALAAAPIVAAPTAGAATPVLKAANIPNFNGVLENATSHTLYELSTEQGAKVHCTTSCLVTWPPLLVKSSVKRISLGAGVKGKIGFVKRSRTTKQVTFNSFPVYTYAGDSGPNQSNGEALNQNGGIWRMVHASARSAGATPYLPILNQGTAKSFTHVLLSTSSRSLYVLSAESGGTLHCTTALCLATWPPLTVTSTTTSITLGAGVKGTIGFVARGAVKQVTFNSYPVYTYSGDTGPNQCSGEGIVADGGTWTLTSAAATTAGTTQVSGTCGTTYPYSRTPSAR